MFHPFLTLKSFYILYFIYIYLPSQSVCTSCKIKLVGGKPEEYAPQDIEHQGALETGSAGPMEQSSFESDNQVGVSMESDVEDTEVRKEQLDQCFFSLGQSPASPPSKITKKYAKENLY